MLEPNPQPRKRACTDYHAPKYLQSQPVFPQMSLNMNSIGHQALATPSTAPIDTMKTIQACWGPTAAPNAPQLGSQSMVQHEPALPFDSTGSFLSMSNNNHVSSEFSDPVAYAFERQMAERSLTWPYDFRSLMQSTFDACLNSPGSTNAILYPQ